MEELTKLLTQIELTADDIIDTKQQIINLDAKRHKNREALNRLKDHSSTGTGTNKHWLCVGDMFVRLDRNQTRNTIVDDQYHIDTGIEKLRDELSEKVQKLRQLEGEPELSVLTLKPLNKREILALRTGFRL